MTDFDPKTHYRCAACSEVFRKGTTDDEAEAEHFESERGHIPLSECDLVCDDCFNVLLPMIRSGLI